MHTEQLTLIITLFSAGLLISGISIPLIKRKVKPNSFYGFRIPKAFASKENWYKINEYGGRLFFYWGLFISATSLIFFLLPPDTAFGYTLSIILFPHLILILLFIMVFNYANKL